MNETFGQKATVATIGGVKETLVFGTRYNVRLANDDVVRGAILSERAANGDLLFAVESTEGDAPARRRIRPSTIDVLVAAPDEGGTSHVAQRKPGETATELLARLERSLGGGQYGRWIETGYGQEILAEAAAEERAARNGKVRRKAAPEKVVDVLSTILPGVRTELSKVEIAAEREVELDPVLSKPQRLPRLTTRGKAKLVEAGADPADVAASETVEELVAKSKGRPYAERNQVWRCGSCKRRTRAPICENGHDPVAAPAGKRREDRGAK